MHTSLKNGSPACEERIVLRPMPERARTVRLSRPARLLSPLLLAFTLTLGRSALAGDPKPDAATLEAARALGRAGLDLFDKGDCPAALDKLLPAYALYKAPTLGLAAARCEVKLGRLASAEQTYREVKE